jgi:hypothetical protein
MKKPIESTFFVGNRCIQDRCCGDKLYASTASSPMMHVDVDDA